MVYKKIIFTVKKKKIPFVSKKDQVECSLNRRYGPKINAEGINLVRLMVSMPLKKLLNHVQILSQTQIKEKIHTGSKWPKYDH